MISNGSLIFTIKSSATRLSMRKTAKKKKKNVKYVSSLRTTFTPKTDSLAHFSKPPLIMIIGSVNIPKVPPTLPVTLRALTLRTLTLRPLRAWTLNVFKLSYLSSAMRSNSSAHSLGNLKMPSTLPASPSTPWSQKTSIWRPTVGRVMRNAITFVGSSHV